MADLTFTNIGGLSRDALAGLKGGATGELDTQLASLYLAQSGGGLPGAGGLGSATSVLAQSAAGSLITGSDGEQYVVIDFTAKDRDGAALLTQLDALGLQHGSSYGAVASGLLRVDQLGSLQNVQDLAFARESISVTHAGSVTTQADHAQHDDIARAGFGVDGTGLKIGILSNSFDTSNSVGPDGQPDTMATDIASGDLPVNTTILQDFNAPADDEGRAMAQLVHDIAPGAAIEFATANFGQAGFANNILALAADGAKVIVDDVFYYAEPAYQNGIIAQAVNTVASQGVAYFSSAGNEGFGGFESAWHDSGTTFLGEQLLDFGPGQNYLSVTATGAQDIITAHWDQPAASAGGAGSASDIDIFLLDGDGNLVAASGADNIGGDPFEGFAFVGNPGETYYLLAGLYSGPAPNDFKVIDYGGTGTLEITPYDINDGTIIGHPAAAGAISVGAADYRGTPAYGASPPVLESFSSAGPTVISFDDAGNRLETPVIRYGPDITAVDGGDTTFFYPGDNPDQNIYPNFYGTSAAAPDAAATALLMLQANGGLTPDDVRALLQDSAIDMDDPSTNGFDVGIDNATGAGLIQADQAVFFAKTLSISNAQATELFGTHFADQITGGNGDNYIDGAAGDDTLDGGFGNDVVAGGDGNDVADGGAGNDSVYGEGGNDVLYGNDGDDQLFGGQGDDTLRGDLGNDTLDGGAGVNTANYQFLAATVKVDLTLQGTQQDTGGAGKDTLINIQNVFGTANNDTLIGDSHANVLSGFRGDDSLSGGGGDDTLVGGAGNDTLDGGDGSDTASYADALSAVTVKIVSGAQNTGGGGVDTLISIENLQGSNYNDSLVGNAQANVLDGGAGADTLVGGAGNDTYVVDNVGDVIVEGANAGIDTVRTTLSTYTLAANLENLVFTGTGSFVGTGNDAANQITGGDAVDRLYGGGGNDTLDGGGAGDSLYGGMGDDVYIVNSSTDVVFEDAGGGYDTVKASASYTLSANVEKLQLTGLNLSGTGNADANEIVGGTGNDTLDGGGGADTLKGGLGDDVYHVDNAGVTVFEAANGGFDTVQTSLSTYTLGANVEALVYTGAGSFNGVGNTSDNSLVGGAGADTLSGGNGADTLVGGGGHDVLTGGAGADVFKFDGPDASSSDEVTDFTKANGDHVGLSASGFGIASMADVDFVSGTAPVAFEGKATLLYVANTGDLYWDGDGTGAGARVLLAHFDHAPALAASDFLVI